MDTFVPLNYSMLEASRLLGIGRSKRYTLVAEGRIRVVRIGTRALVPRAEIEAFQKSIVAVGAPFRAA